MQNPKYKLTSSFREKVVRGKHQAKCYRIQALRDIPEHGVKKGDLGGYVSHKNTLSHEGTCWIGGEAIVDGKRITISDDAYVGDEAVLNAETSFMIDYYSAGYISLSGNAKVTGNAFIASINHVHVELEDYAHVFGHAYVYNVRKIKGHSKIYGNSQLESVASIEGSSEIFGNAQIGRYCHIMGISKILGDAKLEDEIEVRDSVIAGSTHILSKQKVRDGEIVNDNLISTSLDNLQELTSQKFPKPKDQTLVSLDSPYLKAFMEIKQSIATYETDVVKIIKYPVMTDRTNTFTQEMILALNNANRLSDNSESNDFKEAVRDLEKAFLAAESNAVKLVSTMLTESERKKTEKAKDLFRIAADEASSEHEKKVAFVQGFKQLEGVLTVPEVAVDTFRVKIGLKEIEA